MELLNLFHDYMMVILFSILVFVTYAFVSLLRARKLDKNMLDSHALETIWTLVPMVILLFMAFPSLYILYLMEEIASPSLRVKVVAHQWYWEYEYSTSWFTTAFDSYMLPTRDQVLFYNLDVDNRLVLPTLTNIQLLVTSVDVLHSFTVPTLGIKVDACPGRLNYLSTITPFRGVYYGQCSEICGANHSFMPIVVEFVPVETYLNYVTTLNV